MRTVEVDGVRVAYVREGAGEAVLLLHGGMSTHAEWRRQVADLSADHDVIAWDCPGGGASGDPPDDWDLGGFARCVLGLADALGLASAHVVGLSFGGGLALQVFAERPGFVRSLALLSAYAGWGGSLPVDEVARRRAEPASDPRDFLAPDAPDDLVVELLALEAQARSWGTAGRAFAKADLRPVLATVGVPTLVMAGAEDRRCPRYVAEALHAGIAGSRLVVVEGAGHMLDLEAPQRVNEEIRAHVAGR